MSVGKFIALKKGIKMNDLSRIKQVAEEAAIEAGKFILTRRDMVKEIIHKKGKTDLVTDVDKKSEAMIIERIRSEFPLHSILAEESGEDITDSDIKWIIDPLDGTTNFAHTLPIFCVSIGVMVNDRILIGIVYDPNRDELFAAEDGRGAFLNGNKISVSSNARVEESLISTGFAYDIMKKAENIKKFTTMINNAQAVRRPGSAAIDLCYVACGRFDGFWEAYLSPWDTAAGKIIVQEAGGKISKFHNEEYNIFDNELLASNGIIHNEMVELFNATDTL